MRKRFFATSNSGAATLLRVTLGTVMFAHGAQKLLGWFDGFGYGATLEFFGQAHGIPAPVAALVVIGEFFGGLGLITGFLTRLSAAGIVAVMSGAVYFSHWTHGFFMNWAGRQAGEGFEYHILAAAIALSLVVLGGGRASVDGVIGRRLELAVSPAGTRSRDEVEPLAPRRRHG